MNSKIDGILNKHYLAQELIAVKPESAQINISEEVANNQFLFGFHDNFKTQRDQEAFKEIIAVLDGRIFQDFFSFIGCLGVEFKEKVDLNLFRKLPSIRYVEANREIHICNN